VGHLSPDFRLHVVRQFFEPVTRVHDTERFEARKAAPSDSEPPLG
jgi:predicted O-linked N-acetylglucosamine transferase (SPINDLY family)